MENDFRIKKITLCSQKTKLAVETTAKNLNVYTDTEMETLFVVGTFPKRTKGVKQRNLPNARVLHSFNTGESPTR